MTPVVVLILAHLLTLMCKIQPAKAGLEVAIFNNTAASGPPVSNMTLNSLDSFRLPALHSAVLMGELTLAQWAVLSLGGIAGYARLWVDDHLLIDGLLTPAGPNRSSCMRPGGDPNPLQGYRRWSKANMPTVGSNDPHSMRPLGGDCTHGCSLAVCKALCEKLAPQGCVGFVTDAGETNVCYMRRLAGSGDSCERELVADDKYDSYTRDSSGPACTIPPDFCPSGGQPITPPTAAYAIPVPFLPGATTSKLRIEITTSLDAIDREGLMLLANGTKVSDSSLSAVVVPAERRYFSERAEAEHGWNTWLSGDVRACVRVRACVFLFETGVCMCGQVCIRIRGECMYQ